MTHTLRNGQPRLTLAEYRRRDVRVKCSKCRCWMRAEPTAASPAKRAPVPRADLCVACLAELLR